MEEWLGMVKDVGFPIVVTLYLLYRIEHKLDELNDSIRELPGRLYTTVPRDDTKNPHAG